MCNFNKEVSAKPGWKQGMHAVSAGLAAYDPSALGVSAPPQVLQGSPSPAPPAQQPTSMEGAGSSGPPPPGPQTPPTAQASQTPPTPPSTEGSGASAPAAAPPAAPLVR